MMNVEPVLGDVDADEELLHYDPCSCPAGSAEAERFVQTSLREWAYARAYDTSEQRGAELPAFLFRYNWKRPHGGINGKTPISRLGLA